MRKIPLEERKALGALLEQRSPIYGSCADVTVEVSGKSFEEIVEEIVREI